MRRHSFPVVQIKSSPSYEKRDQRSRIRHPEALLCIRKKIYLLQGKGGKRRGWGREEVLERGKLTDTFKSV